MLRPSAHNGGEGGKWANGSRVHAGLIVMISLIPSSSPGGVTCSFIAPSERCQTGSTLPEDKQTPDLRSVEPIWL